MDKSLKEAYQIIFGAYPDPDLAEGQVAKSIINHFDVPKLGEPLAKACLLRIVNHVGYPDRATTREIVGRAQGLATELWDDLSDEPHMADLERKEYEDI
jgi:hypothetical protein